MIRDGEVLLRWLTHASRVSPSWARKLVPCTLSVLLASSDAAVSPSSVALKSLRSVASVGGAGLECFQRIMTDCTRTCASVQDVLKVLSLLSDQIAHPEIKTVVLEILEQAVFSKAAWNTSCTFKDLKGLLVELTRSGKEIPHGIVKS